MGASMNSSSSAHATMRSIRELHLFPPEAEQRPLEQDVFPSGQLTVQMPNPSSRSRAIRPATTTRPDGRGQHPRDEAEEGGLARPVSTR